MVGCCRQLSNDNNIDNNYSSSEEQNQQQQEEELDQEQPLMEATIRYDDGGSNLTERFKYKVNALMGTFDPVDGIPNDERVDGNILNALVTFPLKYKFNIVGKTGNNEDQIQQYVEKVKEVVFDTTGDDDITSKITPRGKNYTKVQCEANVQSVAMLNMIYDNLDKLEMTVMRF
jgi:putative lipoic acid-binding regulatory protein